MTKERLKNGFERLRYKTVYFYLVSVVSIFAIAIYLLGCVNNNQSSYIENSRNKVMHINGNQISTSTTITNNNTNTSNTNSSIKPQEDPKVSTQQPSKVNNSTVIDNKPTIEPKPEVSNNSAVNNNVVVDNTNNDEESTDGIKLNLKDIPLEYRAYTTESVTIEKGQSLSRVFKSKKWALGDLYSFYPLYKKTFDTMSPGDKIYVKRDAEGKVVYLSIFRKSGKYEGRIFWDSVTKEYRKLN